jgi:hypothetical protein
MSNRMEEYMPIMVRKRNHAPAMFRDGDPAYNDSESIANGISKKPKMTERIEATPQQYVDIFNSQVTLLRPIIQRISQEARLADKDAAFLTAGAAGLETIKGVVWVDCNMEAEWFDKNDEKKLMSVAWNDVIGDNNATIKGHLAMLQGDVNVNGVKPFGGVDKVRLDHIEQVLKSFRKKQLSMKIFSLSPSTEAAMSGIVIDLLNDYEQDFSEFTDTAELRNKGRSSVFEHDDRTRRISRMFRRLPLTRNEFCRVAGVVLRYNLSLQDGKTLFRKVLLARHGQPPKGALHREISSVSHGLLLLAIATKA